MHRNRSNVLALAAVAVAIQGCHEQTLPTESASSGPALAALVAAPQPASRHLVVFTAERVPADFQARVSTLGGSVEISLDSVGVATVIGLTPTTAAELAAAPDIQALEPDQVVTLGVGPVEAPDVSTELTANETLAPADATASPTSAPFYPEQWSLRAVFAPEAWAAGHLGSRGVVVALLDSGIDYLQPDLLGLVDLDHSRSFSPEEDPIVAERFPGRLPISDIFFHGTTTAGIIASNATILAGVNRYVTFLAIKVFNRFGEGSLSQVIGGIVYAADQGADVINASLSAAFDKHKNPGIVVASNRAANYAFRKGALLVSITGNDGIDLDHNGDTVLLPCEAPHVICVSGTAPSGAAGATGPWENVDAPAPYTGFGRSAVDVAAPAGQTGVVRPIPATEYRTVWALCTTTTTETSPGRCRFGQRFPDQRGLPVYKSFGTSISGAFVSGLAALLVAQLGHGNPALIRERIIQSADDLGQPGTDPYYGKGRINIARALGVTP